VSDSPTTQAHSVSPRSLPESLRSLPSVGRILELLDCDLPRPLTRDLVRLAIQEARERLLSGGAPRGDAELIEWVLQAVERATTPAIRPAINATGTILNTGLGRAVLPASAVENLIRVATGHSTLEVDPTQAGEARASSGSADYCANSSAVRMLSSSITTPQPFS